MVAASSRSVLAKRPADGAKALTRRGLTTAKGTPAAAKVLATIVSKPPVASMTTSFGLRTRRRSTKHSRPVASRGTQKESWEGRTWMSSWSFEMSMPTTLLFSIVTHPCACGLASWPKRLSGFSGTDAGGDTCSPMVLLDRGRLRLPPAADPRTLSPQAGFKIQGRPSERVRAKKAGWGAECMSAPPDCVLAALRTPPTRLAFALTRKRLADLPHKGRGIAYGL